LLPLTMVPVHPADLGDVEAQRRGVRYRVRSARRA
jgi:hypothetical protein